MAVPSARAFVGRERQLGELKAGLVDAFAGRGRCFLVSGEPGIGKTRLADELSPSIRTGMRCSYFPASGSAISWQL